MLFFTFVFLSSFNCRSFHYFKMAAYSEKFCFWSVRPFFMFNSDEHEVNPSYKWASLWENRSLGFPTRSLTNRAVQSQKMAKGLKFRIKEVEGVGKTKALISFAVTAKLICVFVFAYAKSRFSHNEAQILFKCQQLSRARKRFYNFGVGCTTFSLLIIESFLLITVYVF